MLGEAFHYGGWSVRYQLFEPQQQNHGQSSEIKTAVFIHGTPWSSAVFEPIAKTLLARGSHNVLLYDLPGYGLSQDFTGSDTKSQFQGDTSIKTQAAALSELLAHLKLDGKEGNGTPSVIAHDIAGSIVLRSILLHGCQFRSLLLMDTNTVLPWGDGFYKLARQESDVFLRLPYAIYEAMMRAVVRSGSHDPNTMPKHWEDILAAPWITPKGDVKAATAVQSSFVRQIAQANDADVAEMLDQDLYKNIACPVKLLWGESDKWIPKEKLEQLAEMLGKNVKEFVVIPEAGHLIMVDQPERVAVEVFNWLSVY